MPLARLQADYRQALGAFDLRRSRRMVVDAAAAGASLASLYVGVVRPALRSTSARLLAEHPSQRERAAMHAVRTTLAVVASQPASTRAPRASGRQALVSIGSQALDLLDGQVIADVLAADGWTVEEVDAAATAEDIVALAVGRRAELVVMRTSTAADLLAAARACTLLRRTPDPPVIVACGLDQRDDARRARAAGADAFVADLERLPATVAGHLPGPGTRRWGVRFARSRTGLVVAPTGTLDVDAVGRLRQVVESRMGLADALVVDARDLAAVTEDGLAALVRWLAGSGRSHRLIAGEHVGAALAASSGPAAGDILMDAAELHDTL